MDEGDDGQHHQKSDGSVAVHADSDLETPEYEQGHHRPRSQSRDSRSALGDIARAKGMSHVARDAGLCRGSLYKALSENSNPSFATVLKVARAGSPLARSSGLSGREPATW